MTEAPSKTPRGHGRVAFFALIETFRTLLDAGHPLRSVYDDHREQLGIGYPQFTKYVGRYIRKAKDDGHQREGQDQQQKATASPPATPPSNAGRSSGVTPAPAGSNTDAGSGRKPVFHHDPSSGNNLKDLI